MITIDVIDELEIKTEKIKTPKRRLIDNIWWGIWNNHHMTQSWLQKMIDLANITQLDEINSRKWRVR